MIKVGARVSMKDRIGVVSDSHIDNDRNEEREFKVSWNGGGQSWELEQDLKLAESNA